MKLHVLAVARRTPAADVTVVSTVATYQVSCRSFAAGVSTAVLLESVYVTLAAIGVVVPFCTSVKLFVVIVLGFIATSNVADTVVVCGR
jgi:uncharacterized membrane protein